MTKKTKSWVEKRDTDKNPEVKILDKSFAGMPSGCRMLISTPKEIHDFVLNIPKGRFLSPAEMREQLAKKHNAEATCPVSTGIFLRIVAEAAIEEKNSGKSIEEIAPFWRVVADDSSLAKKLSISLEELKNLRQKNP